MLRTLQIRSMAPSKSRRRGTIAVINDNGTYNVTVLGVTFTQIWSLLGAEYRVGQDITVVEIGGRLVIEP